jgi:hypothetical protein
MNSYSIFKNYYYSLSTVIYNDIVIWIIMLIFNASVSYFHQKKKCKYLKDYLVTKWTLGVMYISASYHPKINLGPNTRSRLGPSKFNTREDYKSKDCKKFEYVITTCRLIRWETKPWYQKIEKNTNKQTNKNPHHVD